MAPSAGIGRQKYSSHGRPRARGVSGRNNLSLHLKFKSSQSCQCHAPCRGGGDRRSTRRHRRGRDGLAMMCQVVSVSVVRVSGSWPGIMIIKLQAAARRPRPCHGPGPAAVTARSPWPVPCRPAGIMMPPASRAQPAGAGGPRRRRSPAPGGDSRRRKASAVQGPGPVSSVIVISEAAQFAEPVTAESPYPACSGFASNAST